MHRLPILLACLCLAFPVLAQDTDDPDTDSTDSSSAPSPDSAAEASDDADESLDDIDDTDVSYDEEEDDAFIPSENVKFGQSIPFPTDI